MGNGVAIDPDGQPEHCILYYAGPCPVCNRLVRWMGRHTNSLAEFEFRPLPEYRSAWIEQGLPGEWWEAPESVLLHRPKHGLWYRESDAVLRVVKALDRRYHGLALVAGWIPKGLRDWCYRRLRPATSLRAKR